MSLITSIFAIKKIMCKEWWKPVVGYEGLYEVSNFGRVRSFDQYVKCGSGVRLLKGRILKVTKQTCGYLQIGLSKNGKRKRYYVHRLVAQAFIPNPHNLPEINHKDEQPCR